MPAMYYRLRWPDASEMDCYSPSLVIKDHFTPGASYELPEFLHRVRAATATASERVRARYGYACSRAEDQLQEIETRAGRFEGQPHARVLVLGFKEHS